MTNKEFALQFNLLAKLMEFHGENEFKIKSYQNAYLTIRRLADPVAEMSMNDLLQLPRIGKNIANKIREIVENGSMSTLQQYVDRTPPGIIELLQVKGIGSKKIKTIHQELHIESPGELLYACEENRLIDLKGFGTKTQQSLISQLTVYMDGRGKYLYGHIIDESEELLGILKKEFPDKRFSLINGLLRKMPIVDGIEILTTADQSRIVSFIRKLEDQSDPELSSIYYKGSKVLLYSSTPSTWKDQLWRSGCSDAFANAWLEKYPVTHLKGEFEDLNISYIPPEAREDPQTISRAAENSLVLLSENDIKGVVHSHSNYSDGLHTIAQMATKSKELGYQYLVMSDHSKAAFYANGLSEDRLYNQINEIDQLNESLSDFTIFKSIECDILNDGRLDYSDSVLADLDVVIASIHSNLKMDEAKAMKRLIKAVEHPNIHILGHPTGRLLLSRPGYSIDHHKLIDACAANHVAIEINANPYRLDLDWQWIPYAMEKGVKVSINPDAHSMDGISDIRYGVAVARKGLLTAEYCLNASNTKEFISWIKRK